MKDIVIFGTGDFAQVARVYFDRDSEYRVVAFTVDGAYITEKTVLGVPVVPFEDLERSHPPDTHAMHISVSFRR